MIIEAMACSAIGPPKTRAFVIATSLDMLKDRGIKVGDVSTGVAPKEGVATIAEITSQPLPAILAEMLTTSDNNTAEMVLKEIGYHVSGQGTRAAGIQVIMAEDSEATEAVLQAQVAVLEQEIDQLRRRLADAPKRQRALEERLLETKGQLAQAVSQNEKLSYTLREAREHISSLRDEVDKLTQPPSAYGVIVGKNDDGTVDVLTSGRKMRVGLHPDIDHESLPRGSEVVLNESFNVVQARRPEVTGEVVAIKELLDDGVRALVIGRADEERVCELADSLRGVHLRSGDTMRLDPRTNMRSPRP